MARAGVAHANTARPERGCGPKQNGLRGFVSRRKWCHGLRSSGDVAETSAYLAGIGRDHGHHHTCGGPLKAPSHASWRSRIAEGHRATTGTPPDTRIAPPALMASAGVDLRKGMKVIVTHPSRTKDQTLRHMTVAPAIARKAAKAPMDSKTEDPNLGDMRKPPTEISG